jgi:hypothetical protein
MVATIIPMRGDRGKFVREFHAAEAGAPKFKK